MLFRSHKISSVIFDCDGVILDSNSLKTQVFELVLTKFDVNASVINQFVSFHKQFGGISRYVKFKKLFEFMDLEFDQVIYDRLLIEFSDLCLEKYKECDLTPHCLEVLGDLKKNGIKLYVVSGSDEHELRLVFKYKKLERFFEKIYGSPKTKLDSLSLLSHKMNLKNTVFIGDAVSDFEAASQYQLPFFFMKRFSDNKSQMTMLSEEHGHQIIDTLRDFKV